MYGHSLLPGMRLEGIEVFGRLAEKPFGAVFGNRGKGAEGDATVLSPCLEQLLGLLFHGA